MKLETAEQINSALLDLGFETKVNDNNIYTKGGDIFPVVLKVNKNELVINCKVAKLEDIKSEAAPWALLELNTVIRPYAFAIAGSNTAYIVDDTPLIITDSIPIGDLSFEELEKAMDTLLIAIFKSKEILTTICKLDETEV